MGSWIKWYFKCIMVFSGLDSYPKPCTREGRVLSWQMCTTTTREERFFKEFAPNTFLPLPASFLIIMSNILDFRNCVNLKKRLNVFFKFNYKVKGMLFLRFLHKFERSGLEIAILIWVSVCKTCLRIFISVAISWYPARRPKCKVFHLPDNPWVSGRKPC